MLLLRPCCTLFCGHGLLANVSETICPQPLDPLWFHLGHRIFPVISRINSLAPGRQEETDHKHIGTKTDSLGKQNPFFASNNKGKYDRVLLASKPWGNLRTLFTHPQHPLNILNIPQPVYTFCLHQTHCKTSCCPMCRWVSPCLLRSGRPSFSAQSPAKSVAVYIVPRPFYMFFTCSLHVLYERVLSTYYLYWVVLTIFYTSSFTIVKHQPLRF